MSTTEQHRTHAPGSRVERTVLYFCTERGEPVRPILQRGTVVDAAVAAQPLRVAWDGDYLVFATDPASVRTVSPADIATERAEHGVAIGDIVFRHLHGLDRPGVVLETRSGGHAGRQFRIYWPGVDTDCWHDRDEVQIPERPVRDTFFTPAAP
jgi:hypothetical protein